MTQGHFAIPRIHASTGLTGPSPATHRCLTPTASGQEGCDDDSYRRGGCLGGGLTGGVCPGTRQKNEDKPDTRQPEDGQGWGGTGTATSPLAQRGDRLLGPVSSPDSLRLRSLTARALGARTSRTPTRDCGEPRWAGLGWALGWSWFLVCSGALSETRNFSNAKALARKGSTAKQLSSLDRSSQLHRTLSRVLGGACQRVNLGVRVILVSLEVTLRVQRSFGQSVACKLYKVHAGPALADHQDYQMECLKRSRRVVLGVTCA